jgi:hypothetical protein
VHYFKKASAPPACTKSVDKYKVVAVKKTRGPGTFHILFFKRMVQARMYRIEKLPVLPSHKIIV